VNDLHRPAREQPARGGDRLVGGRRAVVGDERRAVGRDVRLRDDQHRSVGVVEQARRGRAEHRAGDRAAPAGAAQNDVGTALGRGSHDRLPRPAIAGGDRRLGAEARRVRKPHALRRGGLRLGDRLPLELGQAALDELRRHQSAAGAKRRRWADRGLVDRQHRRAGTWEQGAGGAHGRLRGSGAVERDQQACGHRVIAIVPIDRDDTARRAGTT
jgi:hypothetical protein